MNAFKKIFSPSASEKEFTEKVNKSFKSLKVEGRGTVVVNVKEVRDDATFKQQLLRARGLVKN